MKNISLLSVFILFALTLKVNASTFNSDNFGIYQPGPYIPSIIDLERKLMIKDTISTNNDFTIDENNSSKK